MNDWDNLDNFPADDDDESFDWMNDNSDDFAEDDDDLRWLAESDDDEEDDGQQEWQMPRPARAERSIASQMEEAEEAEFGNTDDLLDWMTESDDAVEEEDAPSDMPDWLSGMDIPDASDEDIAAAKSELSGDEDFDDPWSNEPEKDDTDDSDSGWGFDEVDEPAAELEGDDFLFGSTSEDEEDDTDDFLFGSTSEDEEDDTDDFLFGSTSDDGEELDELFFSEADASASEDDSSDFGGWGEFEAEDSFEEPAVADASGWDLNDIDDDFDFIDEPAPEAGGDADIPDWMADMPVPGEEDAVPDGFDDFSFMEEDASTEDEAVPDWMADMPVPGEEDAVPDGFDDFSFMEEDAGTEDEAVPDWMADMPVPGEEDAVPDGFDDFSFMEEDAGTEDEAVPDWMADMPVPGEEDAVPDGFDDFDFLDEVNEPVVESTGSDLDDLFGEFEEDDSDDLLASFMLDADDDPDDLLASLDIADSDDDSLDDLLSAFDDDSQEVGLDDLFASLEGSEAEESSSSLDELFGEVADEATIITDDTSDPDFLEPVSNDLASDLDFLDPVSDEDDELALLAQLNETNTSDLDFMDGVSREKPQPSEIDEDDELALLAQLNETNTSDLDFMDGVSREKPQPSEIDEDDELALLAQLNETQTSDLDFMDGISRVQEQLQTGTLDLNQLEEDELALINKISTVKTGQLGSLDEEITIPELDDNEIAILNRLSQSSTDELDFMAGIDRDDVQDYYPAPKLDYDIDRINTDDLPQPKKPTTGSLSYLGKIQTGEQEAVDDDPSWLDEISGLDTDTLREAADASTKKTTGSLDIDSLIDSFGGDNEVPGIADIAPTADLDTIFSEMDEEERQRRLADDTALPEWLQEIAQKGDESSTASLIRQRKDRSLDDLDDRLLDLRERGLEQSEETVEQAEEPENQERLGKVVPNIDQALTPAKIIPGTVSITTSPQITVEQEQHTDLLHALAGSIGVAEDNGSESQEEKRSILQAFISKADRFVIALLLIAAVIAPFAYSATGNIGGLPAGAFDEDSEELAAFNLIENLEHQDYVLVAAEYGATGARELDTATRSLLEHMITNGAIPVIVSSDAVGLLRAENIVIDLLTEDNRNQDYVVAGLIPAGTVGLRDFGESFMDTIRTDLRGEPTGLTLNSLDDFSAMVLISESGENVRNWMEQVAPETTTEIIVITGQAARPLAIPYVSASDNAIALLTGYEDAFTYQQMVLAIYNPSDTPQPTATGTNPPTATLEPEATDAPTDVPTETDLPTETPEPTQTPEPTETLIPSETAIPSLTPRPTLTEAPTATNTAAITPTDVPMDTPVPVEVEMIEIAIISSISAADVYTEPSLEAEIRSTLGSGQQVATIQLSEDEEFVLVALPDGSSGWVSTLVTVITEIPLRDFSGTDGNGGATSAMIEVAEIIAESAANIRAGAGTDFNVVASLAPGEQLAVIGRNTAGDWVNVILPDGREGWIADILVRITEMPASEFDGQLAAQGNTTVQIATIISDSRINVRSGAGSDFETVAGLDPDSRVRIIGTSDDGDWYNIVLPNGGEGWIAAFLASVEEIPADSWDGASKDGFMPVYFDRPIRIAQDEDDEDVILIGRNVAGSAWLVYADENMEEELATIPAGAEFIVLEEGEEMTRILLEDGQIAYIENFVIRIEERPRSEVDFAPTATATPTITPTATMTPTPTETPFVPQITPAPLETQEIRASSQALGLVTAIVVIAIGNLFWIFRWLGNKER